MDLYVTERDIGWVNKQRILWTIPILFLIVGVIYGVLVEGTGESLEGLVRIILSPTILITDFLRVGGVAATFVNVAIVGFINLLLMGRYKLKVNGVLLAAFFTVVGFSFFGKNLYNILPIYLGGFVYTRYQRISFKDVIVVMMFATALAPLISEISFTGILPPLAGVLLALAFGVFIGFVIVPVSSHMMRFHEGYNLYNIGFTSGIVGTVLTSLLRSFGIEVEVVSIISESNQWVIILMVLLIIFGMAVAGLWINGQALKKLKQIFRYKGRLITDYTYLVGYGVTFINMALMGLLSLLYVVAVGGVVNGPALAAIFTVMGFSAFGKHLMNTLPIVLGVMVTALLLGYDLGTTGIIISVLFATTLAPVAGHYGPVIGFVAGVLHMILVTNVGIIHGGINLYNNGFSGGIVAGVLIPVVDAFRKES